MQVSYTTKDYTRLLELVHMGLWVAGARPEDPNTMPERYAGVAQKIYSQAVEYGCSRLVEEDSEGLKFSSSSLENGPSHKLLDSFIDDSFWSELVARLAERDLKCEVHPTLLAEDGLSEAQEQRLEQLEATYWAEVEHNGIDRLYLLKGGQG